MIARVIEWCARNRFLVFTGVALLVFAGIWSIGHIPLDALPDISDVQVIIHTNWEGEPPNIIEDQVTYPIVTALLAAPRVKAVRAQTMFNDSYVFVVFEDGTDIYWARSRVIEYLQQIAGRLPQGVNPMIGPDATGAGWVYEYALVDHTGKYSLADLRSLQDWHLRYQLETVPGVAEVASIGGFVRQYQVQLDPNKLLAYGIPLSTVIDRVKSSTNEVGGRVLELSGTRYFIRGLGYLKSLADLENVPVMAKNGTPVLIKDLGTVTFGPDIREGVAEWNGQGETVGGIVVMRYGLNALNVIDGVKKKLAEIKSSLPPAGDRSLHVRTDGDSRSPPLRWRHSLTGRKVIEMMRDLAHGRGRAVVIVTHDSRLSEFADRVVRMEDGMIAQAEHGAAIPAAVVSRARPQETGLDLAEQIA